MDLGLGEEQRAVRELARKFARNEVAPKARAIDESAEFDWSLHQRLGELGFLAMTAPETEGGGGADTLTWCLAVEEIAKASSAVANGMTLTESMVHYLLMLGDEAQRRAWLPRLARGDTICAFGLTEPEAGSDAAAIATTAVADGDHWVLNGEKVFTSGARLAGLFLIVATVDRTRRSKGIRTFLVPREAPGLTIGPRLDLLGVRGFGTADVRLEDCRIPASHKLGGEDGFAAVMRGLDGAGRLGAAATAVGLAQAAMDVALAHGLQRRQFGQRIFDFQAVQFMLADMSAEIDAARLLLWKAAWARDAGLPFTKESAHAKLFAGDMCMRQVVNAMQVLGGYAYSKDLPMERYYRDAKIHQIWDGTNQIQRIVIARRLEKELA